MTCDVLMGTLNSAYSLTHSLLHNRAKTNAKNNRLREGNN